MGWSTPFIVYRIEPDLKLKEVYRAKDLNAARYWLKYIAQPGDVCCRTPTHPKHSKHTGKPEYWGHKAASGSMIEAVQDWQSYAKSRNFEGEFPEDEHEMCE